MAQQIAFGVFTCGDACGATATARQTSLDGIRMRTLQGVDIYDSGVYGTTRNAPVAGNLYRWDKTSLAVADCVNVVIPFGQSPLTPGRWLIQTFGAASAGLAALVPIAFNLTCEDDGFTTTQAAGAVEIEPATLTQTFAALAGDVFFVDLSARSLGTGVTPATGIRLSVRMDGVQQQACNAIDVEVVVEENGDVHGFLVAPAAGNVEIQGFVLVTSPPATPGAEVTIEEVTLRVTQLRGVVLGNGATLQEGGMTASITPFVVPNVTLFPAAVTIANALMIAGAANAGFTHINGALQYAGGIPRRFAVTAHMSALWETDDGTTVQFFILVNGLPTADTTRAAGVQDLPNVAAGGQQQVTTRAFLLLNPGDIVTLGVSRGAAAGGNQDLTVGSVCLELSAA